MNTTQARWIVTLLVAGSALVGLAGCATMEHANTKSLLTQAGFHTLTPSTAKQKEIWALLPANSVQRATMNKKTFYVFKDEAAGVAYVGHEAEYQRYRDLAIQQKIDQHYYDYAEMNRMWAHGWYGAWGPRYMWW